MTVHIRPGSPVTPSVNSAARYLRRYFPNGDLQISSRTVIGGPHNEPTEQILVTGDTGNKTKGSFSEATSDIFRTRGISAYWVGQHDWVDLLEMRYQGFNRLKATLAKQDPPATKKTTKKEEAVVVVDSAIEQERIAEQRKLFLIGIKDILEKNGLSRKLVSLINSNSYGSNDKIIRIKITNDGLDEHQLIKLNLIKERLEKEFKDLARFQY